jgi:hypothetical protein
VVLSSPRCELDYILSSAPVLPSRHRGLLLAPSSKGCVMAPHSEEYGPSWRDCGQRLAELREAGCRGIEVVLVAPAPRLSGSGWTSWGVLVRYPKGTGEPGTYHWHREYFGAGGSWKTATAAIHACCLALEVARQDREAEALTQSRF